MSAEEAFDAALIASELVGNAVRHGSPLPSGHLAVEWTLDAAEYSISVTDGGPQTADDGSDIAPQQAEAHDTSGRGLMIVEALATSWGVTTENGTTTVWARGTLPQAAPLTDPALQQAY